MYEFPLLIGDIGGTNARFAVLTAPGGPVVLLPKQLTADFSEPAAAIEAALAGQICPSPRAAFLAVATRVDGPVVRLTNAAWTIDAARIGSALDLDSVSLVNDYVPVAAASCDLDEAVHLARLGPPVCGTPGARLVLGPGTGLGAGVLIPIGDRFLVHPTEAGHVDFGPSDEEEASLWPLIERVDGRIAAETILSGPGLYRLYRAIAHRGGAGVAYGTPNDVIVGGMAGEPMAGETLGLFGRLLGRFAGDLALLFGATSGVFIGGGIAPSILDALRREFRAPFERKSPYEELMRQVPSFVVIQRDHAFTGLAAIAADPERFVFQADGWTRP